MRTDVPLGCTAQIGQRGGVDPSAAAEDLRRWYVPPRDGVGELGLDAPFHRLHQRRPFIEQRALAAQPSAQFQRASLRSEVSQESDPGQWQSELAQSGDQPGTWQLVGVVAAVAGCRIDADGHEKTLLGVQAQRLRRQPRGRTELAGTQVFLLHVVSLPRALGARSSCEHRASNPAVRSLDCADTYHRRSPRGDGCDGGSRRSLSVQ